MNTRMKPFAILRALVFKTAHLPQNKFVLQKGDGTCNFYKI